MKSFSFPFIVQMGKEMFEKWDKYWSSGSALLAISCVLDPRCKMIVVEYYYQAIHHDDCQRFIAHLKAFLNALFNEYLEEHSKLVQMTSDSLSQSGRYLLAL
jgi:Domain of unknown function (DUF4413)